MSSDFVYDIETYPNAFTMTVEHVDCGLRWVFEISDRKNESKGIIDLLTYLRESGSRMVGFNNIGFDYPVLHLLVRMGKSDAVTLYQKAKAIIDADDRDKFNHMVFPSDRFVTQIDLFKIHHFDNNARATSLKVLEFNMKRDNVEDLPFKPGTVLTHEQIDILKTYNVEDVRATKAFYHETKEQIKFREELSVKYDRDFLNHNDTKIGKDFFAMQLEASGVQLYDYSPDKGRTPRQTKRSVIHLADAILPKIKFEQPEFTRVLKWLKAQSIKETKGVFKDLVASVNGFDFVFGTGGIHGSVDSEIVESDDEYCILDLDVTSYYPNLAISNDFYPEHLGKQFCTIYKMLYEQRKNYPKGTVENAMLKLALNGVYGDSNNPYSVFYDPLFTMKITLNGQLLLCLLAEWLMNVPGLRMIQINTDGLTVHVARDRVDSVKNVYQAWENFTGLNLELETYKIMFIRDCNNYMALSEKGKVKRKGAYDYDLGWHQNHSSLVIPKVAEKFLLDGVSIRNTVENWDNKYDFMLRSKVPRSSYLCQEIDGQQVQIQNVSRYYIAKGGHPLFKWMPPLKGKTEWRKIGVHTGWGAQVCNDIADWGKLPVDFDYYVHEIEKLVLGLS